MKHKNEVEIRVYGIIEKISQTICLQIAGKFPDSMVNILPHNPLQATLIELQVTFKASEAIPYHQFELSQQNMDIMIVLIPRISSCSNKKLLSQFLNHLFDNTCEATSLTASPNQVHWEGN